MRTTETPFLAFWRAANAPLVALGLRPLDIAEAERLYGIHCARVKAEGCDPASAPVEVKAAASDIEGEYATCAAAIAKAKRHGFVPAP